VANEVLGSGDASLANQRFTLKRGPLTYLADDSSRGYASALEVRVNGVLWNEVDSLFEESADSPAYVVVRDETGLATLVFGDGEQGARLPTGEDNVIAKYRIGSGPDGEVAAASLTLLMTPPLGIETVTNPIAASGASTADLPSAVRIDAPRSVAALSRAVSLSDYENLAAGYPGIGKARADALMLAGAPTLRLTVATEEGEPLSTSSTLYASLLASLQSSSAADGAQSLIVQDYVPRRFRVKARLRIDSSYVAATVIANAEAALRAEFSFENRSFGQSLYDSEIVSCLHGVAGVVAVFIDALHFEALASSRSAVLTARSLYIENGSVGGAELVFLNTCELESAT
jgi:predicted phage baseplate assembly protein